MARFVESDVPFAKVSEQSLEVCAGILRHDRRYKIIQRGIEDFQNWEPQGGPESIGRSMHRQILSRNSSVLGQRASTQKDSRVKQGIRHRLCPFAGSEARLYWKSLPLYIYTHISSSPSEFALHSTSATSSPWPTRSTARLSSKSPRRHGM